jgi:hypothetical protein
MPIAAASGAVSREVGLPPRACAPTHTRTRATRGEND